MSDEEPDFDEGYEDDDDEFEDEVAGEGNRIVGGTGEGRRRVHRPLPGRGARRRRRRPRGAPRRVVLLVHASPSDMGRLIGRRGRVVQAMRQLTRAASASEGVRATVDVAESTHRARGRAAAPRGRPGRTPPWADRRGRGHVQLQPRRAPRRRCRPLRRGPAPRRGGGAAPSGPLAAALRGRHRPRRRHRPARRAPARRSARRRRRPGRVVGARPHRRRRRRPGRAGPRTRHRRRGQSRARPARPRRRHASSRSSSSSSTATAASWSTRPPACSRADAVRIDVFTIFPDYVRGGS